MTTGRWQRPWARAVTTVLTIAVMAMIFCFSMQKAEDSDRTSGFISQTVISVFHPDYPTYKSPLREQVFDRVQFIVRKCAHFTEYTMLGFLLRLCLESWAGHRIRKRNRLPVYSLLLGAVYAGTDELHQIVVDGRSGQWTDVLVDSSGVLAGALLATLLIWWLDRRMKTESDG